MPGPFPKCFTNNNSFIFHNTQSRCGLFLSSFYRWENWGQERLSNFLTVIRRISNTAWIWTLPVCAQSLCLTCPGLKKKFHLQRCMWEFTCYQLWACVFPDHSSPVVCICRMLWHSVYASLLSGFWTRLHRPEIVIYFFFKQLYWDIGHMPYKSPIESVHVSGFLYIHRVVQLSSLSFTFVKILTPCSLIRTWAIYLTSMFFMLLINNTLFRGLLLWIKCDWVY